MARILVVEDEPPLALGLEDDLKLEGYEVEVVRDGETASRRAREQSFDLIILDVMLPRKDGFEVCRELRRAGLRTPVILLTAKTQESDKVLGWSWGPTTMSRSLSARANCVLASRQHCAAPQEKCLRFTGSATLEVDFTRCELRRAGEAVEMTPIEFRLLTTFIRHRHHTLSRDTSVRRSLGPGDLRHRPRCGYPHHQPAKEDRAKAERATVPDQRARNWLPLRRLTQTPSAVGTQSLRNPDTTTIATRQAPVSLVATTREDTMMKTTLAGLFLAMTMLAGLLMASLAIAQKDDQAEVMLQAAKQKQLVEGNWKQPSSSTEHCTNHAATTRWRQRLCSRWGSATRSSATRKLGKLTSVILRDYTDQSDQVAAARARLATLDQPTGSSNRSTMVVRRVWSGPDVEILGTLSPDGRYLSDVDMTTGDLALHDLATGKMRHLTNKGSWTKSSERAFFSAISPDGKEVAYQWFNRDESSDLRLVELDGSAPRILGALGIPTDWSPDGKYVLSMVFKFAKSVPVPDCLNFSGRRLGARLKDVRLVAPGKDEIFSGRALYRI